MSYEALTLDQHAASDVLMGLSSGLKGEPVKMSVEATHKMPPNFDYVDEHIINCSVETLYVQPGVKQLEVPHSFDDVAGIYIIRCLANNATYTGASLSLRRRLISHLSLLRSGGNGVHLLQLDWDRYGEDQFEFLACQKPPSDLVQWEEVITLLTDSLDDYGGYNRKLGDRVWTLSSRIMNTEQKLIKRGKFSPLTVPYSHPRLNSSYRRTFCQGSTPFFKSEPLLTNAMDRVAKRLKLEAHIAEFVRLDFAGST